MTEAASQHPRGTPCWVSLMVHSLATSREFYGGLFDWRFRPGPELLGPYVSATLDGQDVAGLGEMPQGRQFPVAWLPFLSTEDADATTDMIRTCGGTVGVGPLESGAVGRYALATDPTGAPFGVIQIRPNEESHPQVATTRTGGPGTQVWHELVTHDPWALAKFYAAVFGYENDPKVSAEFDYIVLRAGDRPVAGIRGAGDELPRGRGPYWRTYFEVTDPDTAARRVTELGGHVLTGPKDTAFGRLAHVLDPEGAAFTLIRTGRPEH